MFTRMTAVAAIAAVPFLVAVAPPQQSFSGHAPSLTSGCPNITKREPIVVQDVTGSTFAGPFHSRLSVYSDGLATVSKNVLLFSQVDADYTVVSQQDVKDLAEALAAGGALQLCDQKGTFADVPLTTVTFFKGGTDAKAHTFSYFDGLNNHFSGVDSAISEFISVHFPGF